MGANSSRPHKSNSNAKNVPSKKYSEKEVAHGINTLFNMGTTPVIDLETSAVDTLNMHTDKPSKTISKEVNVNDTSEVDTLHFNSLDTAVETFAKKSSKIVTSDTSDAVSLGFMSDRLTSQNDDIDVIDAKTAIAAVKSIPQTGGAYVPPVQTRNRYDQFQLPSLSELEKKINEQDGGAKDNAVETEDSVSSNFTEYRKFRQAVLSKQQTGGNVTTETSQSNTSVMSSPYNLMGGNVDTTESEESAFSATSESINTRMELSETTTENGTIHHVVANLEDDFSPTSEMSEGGVIDIDASAQSSSTFALTETDDNSVIDALPHYNSESSSDYAFRKPEMKARV